MQQPGPVSASGDCERPAPAVDFERLRGRRRGARSFRRPGLPGDRWTLAARLAQNAAMSGPAIDLSALRRALAMLAEALDLWRAQAEGSMLKPHLRSAVIQAFEFSYELSLRSLRRVLVERSAAAPRVTELSFNDLLRAAADAGMLDDALRWRAWRELRNATSHAYDEAKAQRVAEGAADFLVDARALLRALEAELGR